MKVVGRVVSRHKVPDVWPKLKAGVEAYRRKSPHEVASNPELVRNWMSDGGDELWVFAVDRRYGGFVTFRIAQVDAERWGTIAIIWIEPRYWRTEVLSQVSEQLSELLRRRGCDIMNFMTKRPGFRKLGKQLGFQPRIIEWMKEL